MATSRHSFPHRSATRLAPPFSPLPPLQLSAVLRGHCSLHRAAGALPALPRCKPTPEPSSRPPPVGPGCRTAPRSAAAILCSAGPGAGGSVGEGAARPRPNGPHRVPRSVALPHSRQRRSAEGLTRGPWGPPLPRPAMPAGRGRGSWRAAESWGGWRRRWARLGLNRGAISSLPGVGVGVCAFALSGGGGPWPATVASAAGMNWGKRVKRRLRFPARWRAEERGCL